MISLRAKAHRVTPIPPRFTIKARIVLTGGCLCCPLARTAKANLTESTVPIFGDGDFFVTWPRYADGVPINAATGKYEPDGDIGSTNVNNTQDFAATNYMWRFCIDRHSNHTVNMSFVDG